MGHWLHHRRTGQVSAWTADRAPLLAMAEKREEREPPERSREDGIEN
jgi:hypothetical protein